MSVCDIAPLSGNHGGDDIVRCLRSSIRLLENVSEEERQRLSVCHDTFYMENLMCVVRQKQEHLIDFFFCEWWWA